MLNQLLAGWSWGNDDYVFSGPDGKRQAIKYGIVLEGADEARAMLARCSTVSDMEFGIALSEVRAGFKVDKLKEKKSDKKLDTGHDNSCFP